jgi:hypothetical protein
VMLLDRYPGQRAPGRSPCQLSWHRSAFTNVIIRPQALGLPNWCFRSMAATPGSNRGDHRRPRTLHTSRSRAMEASADVSERYGDPCKTEYGFGSRRRQKALEPAEERAESWPWRDSRRLPRHRATPLGEWVDRGRNVGAGLVRIL